VLSARNTFYGRACQGRAICLYYRGPNKVCVTSVHTYSAAPTAPGSFYYWSVTAAGNVVTSNPSNPASIQWLTAGTATVTAVEKNAAGVILSTQTLVVTIYPIPAPYISSSRMAACQTFDTTADTSNPEFHLPPDYFMDNTGACTKVCEGSYVEYRAHTSSLSAGTWLWTILGGTIVSGTPTSSTIIVHWGAAGAGNITLTETNAGGCVGTYSVCIDIIAKPISSFTILPNTTPIAFYSTCVDASVVFHDLSSAPGSSIVFWRWDFGDGSISSLPDPVHVFTAAGTYTVTLAVTNACGCIDSSQVEVEVLSEPGPDIECPAVVCEGESAHYATSVSGCSTYTWTVTGGTVTAGGGTGDSYVDVTWGTGDLSGHGYISLSVSGCPGTICPGTTTIKIPIVQTNPFVTGPTNPICTNRPVQYGIPLWPGTRYHWGVVGEPSAVISGWDNNISTLKFTTPGTYTVHVWWQNTLKFCGGDKKFTVVVEDPPAIVGADPSYCVGAAFSCSLSPTVSGDWTISGPAGSVTFTGVSSISGTVPAVPGHYTISVSGTTFCPPAPIGVDVVEALPPPDNISGAIEVCFGQPYTYTAASAMPGGIFEWFVTPGSAATLSTTTGNEVVAVWSGAGTISVRRLTTAAPHCAGSAISLNVGALPVPVNVTGETTPCANTAYNYTHGYADADATTWTINDHTTGSVTSGVYSENNTILWNNVTSITVATITATVLKCGVTHTSSLVVSVNPSPNVHISTTVTTAICSSEPVVFTATCGASTYTWNFGDGSAPVVVSGGVYTVSHVFVPNYTTTSATTYTVCVSVSGAAGCICPTVGSDCTTIDVIPGPHVVIAPSTTLLWCDGTSISVLMTGTVTNSIPTETYQWYKNGVALTGETALTYTATAPGSYVLKVTDGSGCSTYSNVLVVRYVDCTPVEGCPRAITLACTAGPCGSLTCTVSPTGGGTLIGVGWFATDGYTSFTTGTTGVSYTLALNYSVTGTYNIHAFGTYDDGCSGEADQTLDIPVIAHFGYTWNCATSPYELHLHAAPDVLTGYTVSHAWTVTGTGGGTYTVSDPVLTGLSAGSHTVTYEATTTPSGSCKIVETIVVPAVTSINFTASPSLPYNLCEGLPVVFIPVVTAGTVSPPYHWNFGDGATLIQNPGSRNFEWSPLVNPATYTVTLTGTNSIGCPFSVSNSVNVYRNTLLASVTNLVPVVCIPPVTLTASVTPGYPGYTYAWQPTPPVSTSVNDFVTITGAYFVTVTDSRQCQKVTLPSNAIIINTTPPAISGASHYCYGDVIKLNGYAGGSYSYQWYRDGFSIPGATGETLAQSGVLPGTYNYKVSITFTSPLGATCTVYSANYPVTMYALPAPPTITGPVVVSCPTYELELTASSGVSSPTYVWSSGSPGYGATNTINSGGAYRCWLTDLNGCTSHADIVVPAGPETYRDWFPTGCYFFCSNVLDDGGIRLFGPPGPFDLWKWILNSSVISSGGPGTISPITISSSGSYELYIDNGLCDATFSTMEVKEEKCQCKQVIDSVKVECDTALGHPHGYIIKVWITNPYGGPISATIGTTDGPMVPSMFTMTAGGSTLYTFDFTVITIPPPLGTTVWLHYTVDGRDCYDSYKIQELPHCTWTDEKPAPPAVTKAEDQNTGMMLHPNPAQSAVNVTYTYAPGDAARSMKVYDALGRQVTEIPVLSASGTISIPMGKAAPGIYLVKMEENGRTLHVQRLIINR